jgi:hypothetical protein
MVKHMESNLEFVRQIADQMEAGKDIGTADLRRLLDMNRDLRRVHDVYEREGPEARLRVRLGQPHRPRRFDDVFRPIMGLDDL